MPTRTALVRVLALLLAKAATAQLNPVFVRQFVDVGAGGNGNIGVTQDEVGLD